VARRPPKEDILLDIRPHVGVGEGEERLVVELEDDSPDCEPETVDRLAAPDLRPLVGARLDAVEEAERPSTADAGGRGGGEEDG